MLTYTPPQHHPQPPASERPWLLLLLAFAWLWPGVVAHDLWAPGEPALYTVVTQWRAGGHWALPMLFDQPYWPASPLFVWLAALSQKLFSPWLADAYTSTRMANVFLTVVAFTCVGGAARQFLGRRYGRLAVLILIGCPGLLTPNHFIDTTPVLLTGTALCLYGWSLAPTRVMMAALMLGGGWLVLSLSGSLLWPGLMMVMALLLLCSRLWRQRRYYLVLGIALLWALPLMAVWPLALYRTDAAAFGQWWQHHALLPLGGMVTPASGFSLFYYLKNLLWFAFPAWPLAVWTASRMRLPETPWGVLAIVWLAVSALFFALVPAQFQDWLVITLPPLAVLGAAKLEALRRGAAAFLNWFGIMTFGLLALFVWLGFAAMNYGWPAKLAERAAYFSPYYQRDIDYFPLIVACLFTPLWLWAITRKHIRGRQAVTNWAAGTTLVWSLLLTLFLPWLDAAKSQRPVVQQMQQALSESDITALQQGHDCVGVAAQHTEARIAFEQYGWIKLEADNPACNYRLIYRHPRDTHVTPGWQEIWAGARPREKHQLWALWHKQQ
ncbi:4-amino-4-deoxy-L-arabinose transferase-like glycosyltransferase [Neisseria sp. HSC-16F19]|nr:glycosyltransferase family 39 protein [Neisseria sp. HSC-16F19]MCP2041388.1 4-amino-4-deoxy-L-arabinose transferase-like glycosyltransferase [Neisseria sp. HSC-16F19]